jgi:hypothetical protein
MPTVAFVVGGVLATTENKPAGACTEKTTALGGPGVIAVTLTVGDGAVEQNAPEVEPEHVAKVVFERTVPPFIVATMESPADEVNEKGAAKVNDAVPVASVVAVPVLPASGPAVIVKVTRVPATGTPLDKTIAVLVMVEPAAPHMIEEVTGERTTEGGTLEDPEHPLMMVSLPLMVTEPFLARARPVRVPPFSVMLASAIIFPAKLLPVCIVAEVPTCQKTLQGDAPPAKTTLAPVAVVSVLPIWKIQTSVGLPVSVKVPFNNAAVE